MKIMKVMIRYLISMIAGYFSGSILFGYYIPKVIKNVDVCDESVDGNPGTYNAFVYGGFGCGVMTLLADLLKGFLPVYISAKMFGTDSGLFSLIMVAPVVGHAFPVFYSREGGKAIAVSFGVLLGIVPDIKPLCILIFFFLLFSLLIRIKEHNKRSIMTFGCFAIVSLFWVKEVPILVGCLLISLIVLSKLICSESRQRNETLAKGQMSKLK